MTERELNQLGLLEEFSITELEQRLEFEAWCDSCESNGTCTDTTCPTNTACPPINNCGGGGGGCGGDPSTDTTCIIDQPC